MLLMLLFYSFGHLRPIFKPLQQPALPAPSPCRLFLESTLHTYICHQEIYGQHLIYVTVLSHIVRPAFQLKFDAVLEVVSLVAFGQAVF